MAITQQQLQPVLDEWWTGRVGDGSESPRVRWRDGSVGGMASRAYTPEIDALSALLAASLSGAYRVAASLAVGADGATDVRIEVQDTPAGAATVLRWRPAPAALDLDDVIDRNATRRQRASADPGRADRLAAAFALDIAAATEDDARNAASALKRHRDELRERLEARTLAGLDVAVVNADLAAVGGRLGLVSAEVTARVAARKVGG